MKEIFSLVVFAFFSITSMGAVDTQHGKQNNYPEGHYTIKTVQNVSFDDAEDIIANIIKVVGLKPKFEVKAANIPNAAAVIYNRKRYILYNPGFVAALNNQAKNQWASVSILAHEIGHHLDGHTLEAGGSNPEIELEADEFSGFVLQKMGATLAEAQVAMKIAASQRESHTHPAQANRLLAIEKGWKNARELQGGSNSDVAKKYQQSPTFEKPLADASKPALVKSNYPIDEQYIQKDIIFDADNSSDYYLSTGNKVIRVRNNNIEIIGKMAALNNARFPLIIYNENKNYFLVTKYGAIVNPAGIQVGQIKEHQ